MQTISYIQVVVSLLAVLCMLWAVSWGMRRFMVPPALRVPSEDLKITGHLALDVKHRLIEVSVHNQRHYVILGGSQPVILPQKEGNG